MEDFKQKIYNYEANPPSESWDKIQAALKGNKPMEMPMQRLRKKSKLVFYGLTAVASLLIIFLSSVLFNKSGSKNKYQSIFNNKEVQAINNPDQKIIDSIKLNNKILQEIISSSKDNDLTAQNYENTLLKNKKYITISGPEGRPVQISPKVATLIESADNGFPPKPVWNKKIEKWKQIMLKNIITTSSINLIDLAQLTTYSDNN